MGQCVVASVALVFLLLGHCQFVHGLGHFWRVGDDKGWNLDIAGQDWPRGKNFSAGDVLVFNYNKEQHNVLQVRHVTDFNGCTASIDSKIYDSGQDKIELVKGPNYFICFVVGHCKQFNMKLTVEAN